MSYASAVRRGVAAASRLHRDLGSETRITHEGGQIDVAEAASTLGLVVLFRPLDKLLGAFVRAPQPGALITTKRPLSVQRLTLAHELGHFLLQHNPSLDDENVLRRAAIPNSGVDDQEVEADAFAFEFLLPRWLFLFHCRRQGWLLDDLKKASVVYQLSLRLGASYEATCRTLVRHRFASDSEAEDLLAATPRNLKKALLGTYTPPDYRGDVWLLTRRDDNSIVDGNHNDLLVLRLEERSSAGYLWNIREPSHLSVVNDLRATFDEDEIGASVQRVITTQSEQRQRGELILLEQRPWQPSDAVSQVTFRYDLTGPEEGLSRFDRRQRLEAA